MRAEGLTDAPIVACLGYSDRAQRTTIADALAHRGSRVAQRQRVLDTEHFDSDLGQYYDWFVEVSTRGARVTADGPWWRQQATDDRA